MKKVNIEYPFVDNVRLFSMLSIVIFHSFYLFYADNTEEVMYPFGFKILLFSFLQLGRFGNICFFCISGLLYGEKMRGNTDNRNMSLDYISRRINILKKPTFLFLLLNLLTSIFISTLKFLSTHKAVSWVNIVEPALSSQWFIIALIIGMALLHLLGNSNTFLLLLGIVSIFMGVNVYFQWLPLQSNYQSSIGFIFYMFLGYRLGLNPDLFAGMIRFVKDKIVFFIILLIVFYAISIYDGLYLYQISGSLPFNNIKLSNQLYAVMCFLIMSALFIRPIFPQYVNPRVETVGIYYVHQMVLFGANLTKLITLKLLHIDGKAKIPFSWVFPCGLFSAIAVYVLTLLIVKYICRTEYVSWIGILKSKLQ